VFEYCFLDRFQSLLSSSNKQFGFKKGISCSNAIYTVRNITDRYIARGSTVNLCTIDLSKAFDKVNHYALYIKLMKRQFPVQLLDMIIALFSNCSTCIKWDNIFSEVFEISFGVRQGSVLSPILFALYIDDIGKSCFINCGHDIILYADDIILIAPSVTELEKMLHMCENELRYIDMSINYKKSCSMRIGPRCNAKCANIVSLSGQRISWVTELRYLGIFLTCSRIFTCSTDSAKRSFYRSANAIFGKVGRIASEETVLELIKTKCIPALMFGMEACPLKKRDINSLDFVVNRLFMKLLKTSDINIVRTCQHMFGFELPSVLLDRRTRKFLEKNEKFMS